MRRTWTDPWPATCSRPGLGKPFLYLGSEGSLATTAGAKAGVRSVLQEVAAGQGHVLTVAGTGHFNFTDRGVYFDLVDSLFLGSIDGARALRVTSTYVERSSAPTFWAAPIYS
jgi:hypothetical protein